MAHVRPRPHHPDRANQGALCDVLAEELWRAVVEATPAAVPGDVLLAVLGELAIRAAGAVAHEQGVPHRAVLRMFVSALAASADEVDG